MALYSLLLSCKIYIRPDSFPLVLKCCMTLEFVSVCRGVGVVCVGLGGCFSSAHENGHAWLLNMLEIDLYTFAKNGVYFIISRLLEMVIPW